MNARAKPMAAAFEKKDNLIVVRAPESLKRELIEEAQQNDLTLSKHILKVLENRVTSQSLQGMGEVLRRITRAQKLLRYCMRTLRETA